MPYRSLADFLEKLADRGQLLRIGAEVDPVLELAEIARRTAAAGGPALLFDRVRGGSLPMVANLLGTPERVCLALEIGRPEEIGERTAGLVRQGAPQGWLERLKLSSEQPAAERFRPKVARNAPCQQIVRLGRDIDLGTLAVLQAWPDESPRLISAATLVVADPTGARRMIGCRLYASGPLQLALVDDGAGELADLWQACQLRQEKLPAAVFLGGDPAYRIAAAVPVAADVDRYVWLGLVRGAALEVARCRNSALEVPADADVILEGALDPTLPQTQSPDGLTVSGLTGGYYRQPVALPTMQVEALTQRSSAVLPAQIGTSLGGESAAVGQAVERILLPVVQAAVPELVDYALPGWGGEQRFALLAIHKTAPLQARRAASALWGLPALQSVKFVVLVDDDVDVHDAAQVWARVGANVDPGRDVFLRDGPALAIDHAFAARGIGRQLGIDATRKLPGEVPQAGPPPLLASQETRDLVDRRWKEYGL